MPGGLGVREEVDADADVHALDCGAREHRPEQVDRVARAGHERDVAGAEQHPQEVHETFLRAERKRRLALRVELDAVAVAVEVQTASRSRGRPRLDE